MGVGSGSRTAGEAATGGAEVSEAEHRDQPLQCGATQERHGERAPESEYSCVQDFHLFIRSFHVYCNSFIRITRLSICDVALLFYEGLSHDCAI